MEKETLELIGEDAVSDAQIHMQIALRALQDYEEIATIARTRAAAIARQLRNEMETLVAVTGNDLPSCMRDAIIDYAKGRVGPTATSASTPLNKGFARTRGL
jgi:hypothetical protein